MAPTNATSTAIGAILNGTITMGTDTNSTDTTILSPMAAFWGVVAIAFNAMAQPSGSILIYPSSYSFHLRASPMICAVSVLDSVGKLVAYSARQNSMTAGLKEFMAVRFYETSVNEKSEFNAFRRNTYFRAASFFIGPVTQAIKIFSVRGVPWIQVACAAFLADFILNELILALARWKLDSDTYRRLMDGHIAPCLEPRPLYRKSIDLTLLLSVLAGHMLLLVILGIILDMSRDDDGDLPPNPLVPSLISFLAALVFLGPGLISTQDDETEATSKSSWRHQLYSCVLILVSMIASPFMYGLLPNKAIYVLQVMFMGVVAGFIIYDAKLDIPQDLSVGCYFTFIHALGAFVYLQGHYDAASTSRPSWSSWFG